MFFYLCSLLIFHLYPQAINEYLISSSTSNNAKANFDGSQHLKRIEQDALSILGPILGRCAQSLLIVSSLHFNSLLRNRQSASNSKTLKSMNDALHDFTSSIGAVLGCLQIEQMVRLTHTFFYGAS